MRKTIDKAILAVAILALIAISVTAVIMILPASATSVLDISVTESMSLEDTYNGTWVNGTVNGSGVINITNTLSNTPLFDLVINFSNGTTDSATWTTASPGVNLTRGSNYVEVHINYLDNGSSALINYNLSSASKPLLFDESYVSNKILVNDSTNVSVTLIYNSSTNITNVQVVKRAADVNSNSISDFNFSNDVPSLGSSSITGNDTITWTIPELNSSTTTATLNFTVTEADSDAHNSSTPQSSVEFYMGNATVSFTILNGGISGSGVGVNGDPTATTLNFLINLQKKQLTTADNGTGGNDWGFTPQIQNTDIESINYSISAVTVYVTNSTDLNQSAAFATITYTTPGSMSNASNNPWNQTEWKVYDFPDPVPVGWIDVDLSVNLTTAGGQLSEIYSTTNGSYVLVEKIYVINGYLVEVRKTITRNATADYYDITLWVHNKGNLRTPPTVVAYDIVPQNFSVVAGTMNPPSNGTTPVVSPIIGTAYWWNVGPLEADGTPGNETYINYTVNGTGIYRMMDLFIVGIDPTYSLTLQTTPVLSISSLVAMDVNAEPLLSMITLGMLLIGLAGRKKNGKRS